MSDNIGQYQHYYVTSIRIVIATQHTAALHEMCPLPLTQYMLILESKKVFGQYIYIYILYIIYLNYIDIFNIGNKTMFLHNLSFLILDPHSFCPSGLLSLMCLMSVFFNLGFAIQRGVAWFSNLVVQNIWQLSNKRLIKICFQLIIIIFQTMIKIIIYTNK